MKIEVLGTGCAKCTKLADLTVQAANELELDYELSKVQDINDILAYGVMVTPALVVDGEVKLCGKLPSLEQLKSMLK